MTNCPECGEQIKEGEEKCPSCGELLLDLNDKVLAHINLLKKKSEQDPSNIKLHLDLGDLFQKHGCLHEALAEYQKATTVDVSSFSAHLKYASVCLKLKKYTEAENAFHAALHLKPKSIDPLIGLFRIYYLEKKTAEATTLGEKIIESRPDNVEFHMLLKNLYSQKGNKTKVLAELQKLESLVPNNEQVITEIALHYKNEKNIEKVIEYYYKMKSLAIDNIELGMDIGKYYYDIQDYTKAIEHLNDLLQHDNLSQQADTELRSYLALAYFYKNNIADAKKITTGIQPDRKQYISKGLQRQLGMLCYKIGQNDIQSNRTKDAIIFFEKAAAYDPANTTYREILDTTKSEHTTSGTFDLYKIAVAGVCAIAAIIYGLIVWDAVHNKIVIRLEPADDAVIYIDGKPVASQNATSGIIISHPMLIGKHSVVVEKTGYNKWEGSVVIAIGRSAVIDIELIPIYYHLKLNSQPESARVIIDNEFAGYTPFSSSEILACPHVITIQQDGHATWSDTLTHVENDTVNMGLIMLKNLAGKWYGTIGTDSYAYDAAFNMIIQQTKTTLIIKYYHKPREDLVYSGTIKGSISGHDLHVEDNISYKYYKLFYWAKGKEKITMEGKISDDWNRLQGKHYTKALGEHDWQATCK